MITATAATFTCDRCGHVDTFRNLDTAGIYALMNEHRHHRRSKPVSRDAAEAVIHALDDAHRRMDALGYSPATKAVH